MNHPCSILLQPWKRTETLTSVNVSLYSSTIDNLQLASTYIEQDKNCRQEKPTCQSSYGTEIEPVKTDSVEVAHSEQENFFCRANSAFRHSIVVGR